MQDNTTQYNTTRNISPDTIQYNTIQFFKYNWADVIKIYQKDAFIN